MARSLLVDVAMKVTGGADVAAAAGSVEKVGTASDKTKIATAALAGAATAGFAVMTKGALEMESAQGDFMAATGKSREEAVAFSKDMNGLSGTAATVGRSFDEIASAGIEVTRQFDVTGDQATQLTADVLSFSKVTGQDATESAGALEDALSAFGLGAEDAAGMMDVLVKSNQEFGTDVGPTTLEHLKKMAPALQAMGVGADEAVGFLNLFEGAGLDAAGAMKGFNAAIANIPPGKSLESVLEKVQAIEDPLKRAQYATEIFGAKAGAGLANALKPGGLALSDYIITADEAAGASDAASEAMLTTSDRIRMLGEKAQAALRDIGSQLGAVVTATATVVPLLASVTGGLWAKVAALAAAQGGWVSMLGAMAPFIGAGAAVAVGLLAINEGLNKSNESMVAARDALAGMTDAQRQAAADTEVLGFRLEGIADGFAQVVGYVAPWHSLADTSRDVAQAFDATGGSAAEMALEIQQATTKQIRAATEAGVDVSAAYDDMADSTIDSATEIADEVPKKISEASRSAAAIAGEMPGAMAARLRGARDGWRAALDVLKDDIDQAGKRGKEIAELEAALTGKAIARGLQSTDPIVRQQAQDTVDIIETRLAQLKGSGFRVGAAYVDDVARGLASGDKKIQQSVAGWSHYLRAASPPRGGPLRAIGEWGRGLATAYLEPFGRQLRDGMAGAMGSMSAPGLAVGSAGAGAARHGITVNVYAGVGDPVAIGREVDLALRAYRRASGTE